MNRKQARSRWAEILGHDAEITGHVGPKYPAGMSTLASAATTRRPRQRGTKASALASKRAFKPCRAFQSRWLRALAKARSETPRTCPRAHREVPSTSLAKLAKKLSSMTCWEEPRWLIKAPMRWGKGSLRLRVKALENGASRAPWAKESLWMCWLRSLRRCASAVPSGPRVNPDISCHGGVHCQVKICKKSQLNQRVMGDIIA